MPSTTRTLNDTNRANLGHHQQGIRRQSARSLSRTPGTTSNIQNLEDNFQCHFKRKALEIIYLDDSTLDSQHGLLLRHGRIGGVLQLVIKNLESIG